MKHAVITLSPQGAALAHCVANALPHTEVYLHEQVASDQEVKRFTRVIDLTGEIFHHYSGLVYIAPCGVVVRAVAPYLEHKTSDPAVVAVDAGGSRTRKIVRVSP